MICLAFTDLILAEALDTAPAPVAAGAAAMELRITLGLVGALQVAGREKRGVWEVGLVEKNGFESEVGGANAIF